MSDYPRLEKLGVKINMEPFPHVRNEELNDALKKAGMSVEKFSEYFGVQTCLMCDDGTAGLYPWDCESTLERLISGKLTGTQLWMD